MEIRPGCPNTIEWRCLVLQLRLIFGMLDHGILFRTWLRTRVKICHPVHRFVQRMRCKLADNDMGDRVFRDVVRGIGVADGPTNINISPHSFEKSRLASHLHDVFRDPWVGPNLGKRYHRSDETVARRGAFDIMMTMFTMLHEQVAAGRSQVPIDRGEY